MQDYSQKYPCGCILESYIENRFTLCNLHNGVIKGAIQMTSEGRTFILKDVTPFYLKQIIEA